MENNDPAEKRGTLPSSVPVSGLRRTEHIFLLQYTWREGIIIPHSHLFSMVALYPGPIEVGGIRLKNHLLLAAGILGTTGASLARLLQNGAGGVVTKSIGPSPKEGHPGPCLIVVDGGIINAMGLPNPSAAFVDELAALQGEPVVVSIFGGSPERVPDGRRVVRRHGVRARAEPLLPPRGGLRGSNRERSCPRGRVHTSSNFPRGPDLGETHPERRRYR
jgi:Dihydroorotate dehydrogenase